MSYFECNLPDSCPHICAGKRSYFEDTVKVIKARMAKLDDALAKSGMDAKVWQYFTIVPDIRTTGVVDGKRTELWPVIIRAVNTTDAQRAAQKVLRTDAIPASVASGAVLQAAAQLIHVGASRSALAILPGRQIVNTL